MKIILTLSILLFLFNACSTKKEVCTDCTARIPEPNSLKEDTIKANSFRSELGK